MVRGRLRLRVCDGDVRLVEVLERIYMVGIMELLALWCSVGFWDKG
jgi:hypothetical protein